MALVFPYLSKAALKLIREYNATQTAIVADSRSLQLAVPNCFVYLAPLPLLDPNHAMLLIGIVMKSRKGLFCRPFTAR